MNRLLLFFSLIAFAVSLHAEEVNFSKIRVLSCESYQDLQVRKKCKDEEQARKSSTFLALQGGSVSNSDISVIKSYPNLSSLDISRSKVNVAGLAAIASHPKISFINLSGTPVSVKGLAALNQSKSIKRLDLSSTRIDDSIVNVLKIHNVQYLNLSETRLTPNGAESLVAAFPNLGRLDLAGIQLSDATLVKFLGKNAPEKYVQILEKKKQFSLGNLFWNKKERMDISNEGLGDLNDLNLSGTKITDDSIFILSAIKNLRFLDISYSSISDEGMKDLPRNNKIEVLSLGGTFVTDRGIKKLKYLKNLQVLGLESSFVTDKGLEHIEEIVSLRSIYLKDSKVTMKGIRRLQLMLPNLIIHYPGYKKI